MVANAVWVEDTLFIYLEFKPHSSSVNENSISL